MEDAWSFCHAPHIVCKRFWHSGRVLDCFDSNHCHQGSSAALMGGLDLQRYFSKPQHLYSASGVPNPVRETGPNTMGKPSMFPVLGAELFQAFIIILVCTFCSEQLIFVFPLWTTSNLDFINLELEDDIHYLPLKKHYSFHTLKGLFVTSQKISLINNGGPTESVFFNLPCKNSPGAVCWSIQQKECMPRKQLNGPR